MNLEEKIRDVPDFPKKGIVFKDITPLLQDAAAFRYLIDLLTESCRDKEVEVVVVELAVVIEIAVNQPGVELT